MGFTVSHAPEVNRYLNVLPLGRADDADVAFDLRSEDVKLPLGLTSATVVGKVCRHHIHETKFLVGTFRSTAVTFLELVDRLNRRLHGEPVNWRQWDSCVHRELQGRPVRLQ